MTSVVLSGSDGWVIDFQGRLLGLPDFGDLGIVQSVFRPDPPPLVLPGLFASSADGVFSVRGTLLGDLTTYHAPVGPIGSGYYDVVLNQATSNVSGYAFKLGGTDQVAMVQLERPLAYAGLVGAGFAVAIKGNLVVHGSAQGDTVRATAGADQLFGGGGGDVLIARGGHDLLHGEAGNDRLLGQDGDDRLFGDAGSDTLLGGNGQDWLLGGAGRDRLSGEAGADRFVFLTGDTGARAATRDQVTDFSHAQGDRIDLSGIDAVAGGRDDAFHLGCRGFEDAGDLRVRHEFGAHGLVSVVEGDVNGDGRADFSIELAGLLHLGAGDFVL